MRRQRSPAELGLDRYDKGRLRQALKKVTDKRTYIRLKAVLLVAEGKNIPTVAKRFDKSFQVVYQWVNRYLKTHRAASLLDAPRAGHPKAAERITDRRILEELNCPPPDFGYHTYVWTVALRAKHLSVRYGCSIRPRTLYRRMKQIGLRSKRPSYVYSEKDPNPHTKKRAIVRKLSGMPASAVLLFEDETDLKLFPELRRAWSLKGRQAKIAIGPCTPANTRVFCPHRGQRFISTP